MKVTIEVELTDEDLEAAHFAYIKDEPGRKMEPDEVVGFFLMPAIQRKLLFHRSQMKWVRGKLWKHTKKKVTTPVEGGHECEESPTGKCWYCHEGDPLWDFCVFCNSPDERK